MGPRRGVTGAYLDASALVKLLESEPEPEPESEALLAVIARPRA
jgi:hypothetical protein